MANDTNRNANTDAIVSICVCCKERYADDTPCACAYDLCNGTCYRLGLYGRSDGTLRAESKPVTVFSYKRELPWFGGRYQVHQRTGVQHVHLSTSVDEDNAKLIVRYMNNWSAVKHLFLGTQLDATQFLQAISKMIQEDLNAWKG